MKEGRKPEYPEKTSGDELQKMPHTKAQRFKPKARLEPVQYRWWQARKADVLTVKPRVAPTFLGNGVGCGGEVEPDTVQLQVPCTGCWEPSSFPSDRHVVVCKGKK